jgi:hypothetical protein
LLIFIFLVNIQAMSEATFWFTTVITVIILMIPVLAWRFYFVDVCPTLSDRVRLKQRLAQLRYVESPCLSISVLSRGPLIWLLDVWAPHSSHVVQYYWCYWWYTYVNTAVWHGYFILLLEVGRRLYMLDKERLHLLYLQQQGKFQQKMYCKFRLRNGLIKLWKNSN